MNQFKIKKLKPFKSHTSTRMGFILESVLAAIDKPKKVFITEDIYLSLSSERAEGHQDDFTTILQNYPIVDPSPLPISLKGENKLVFEDSKSKFWFIEVDR